MEDSGRCVSAFPGVSIPSNDTKWDEYSLKLMFWQSKVDNQFGFTLCARSRRLSERLTFFLLTIEAPELCREQQEINGPNQYSQLLQENRLTAPH